MIDIKGIGSEGVILITAFLIFKDVILPLLKRVFIPWWGKKVLHKPNPTATQQLNRNPNSLTLAKVGQALEDHEKHDLERTDDIKKDIRKIRDKQSEHGERLASLESPGR